MKKWVSELTLSAAIVQQREGLRWKGSVDLVVGNPNSWIKEIGDRQRQRQWSHGVTALVVSPSFVSQFLFLHHHNCFAVENTGFFVLYGCECGCVGVVKTKYNERQHHHSVCHCHPLLPYFTPPHLVPRTFTSPRELISNEMDFTYFLSPHSCSLYVWLLLIQVRCVNIVPIFYSEKKKKSVDYDNKVEVKCVICVKFHDNKIQNLLNFTWFKTTQIDNRCWYTHHFWQSQHPSGSAFLPQHPPPK